MLSTREKPEKHSNRQINETEKAFVQTSIYVKDNKSVPMKN